MSKEKNRGRFTYADPILITLVLLFISFVVYRVAYTLDYKWNWSVIGQYIIRHDEEGGGIVPGLLLVGLFTTLKLSFWSGLLASILGLITGLMRISDNFILRKTSAVYVHLIRNIPSIVFIFIFYFFFSSQLIDFFQLDSLMMGMSSFSSSVMEVLFCSPEYFPLFLSAIFTLAIYEGAYMTEIVRAGIESVENGQWEASDSLGFSRFQRMRFIILPQAIRRILPSVAGQLISVIKDSAIVSVISVQDLTFRGMELMASTYRTFEIWITITLMYFLITFTCSYILRRLNIRMERKGYLA